MEKRLKEPKVSEEKCYGLFHIESGKLLRMEIESNRGRDFCGDQTVRLTHHDAYDDYPLYETDKLYKAEYVRQTSTEWYNSSAETPQHHYEARELQVVEIHRVVTLTPKEVEIPSWPLYMTLRYKDTDPEHLEYVLEEYMNRSKYQKFDYGLYGLEELIEEKKWTPPKEDMDE